MIQVVFMRFRFPNLRLALLFQMLELDCLAFTHLRPIQLLYLTLVDIDLLFVLDRLLLLALFLLDLVVDQVCEGVALLREQDVHLFSFSFFLLFTLGDLHAGHI
jgi:hypothetical protein